MLPSSCTLEKGCARGLSSRRVGAPGNVHSLPCVKAHDQTASHSQRRQHAPGPGGQQSRRHSPADTLQWDKGPGTIAGQAATGAPHDVPRGIARQAQLRERQQSHSLASSSTSSGGSLLAKEGRESSRRTGQHPPKPGRVGDAPAYESSSIRRFILADRAGAGAAGGEGGEAALAGTCVAAAEEGFALEVVRLLREARVRRLTLTRRGHVRAVVQVCRARLGVTAWLWLCHHTMLAHASPYSQLVWFLTSLPRKGHILELYSC